MPDCSNCGSKAGCSCAVSAGPGILITGNGSPASPFIISTAGGSIVTGSVPCAGNTLPVSLSGFGTPASPLVASMTKTVNPAYPGCSTLACNVLGQVYGWPNKISSYQTAGSHTNAYGAVGAQISETVTWVSEGPAVVATFTNPNCLPAVAVPFAIAGDSIYGMAGVNVWSSRLLLDATVGSIPAPVTEVSRFSYYLQSPTNGSVDLVVTVRGQNGGALYPAPSLVVPANGNVGVAAQVQRHFEQVTPTVALYLSSATLELPKIGVFFLPT